MQANLSLRQGAVFPSRSHTRRALRAAAAATSDPLMQKPTIQKPVAPAAPSAAPAAAAQAPAVAAAPADGSAGVTVEYQRKQAKEMQTYFRSLDYVRRTDEAQILGWTRANEISNGRWVMMGLLVGLLTEYATGVSFIGQLKLMLSYSGLWDFDS